MDNFKLLETLTGHTDYMSSFLTWSGAVQDYLISGSYDGTIKIWNLKDITTEETFECIKTLTGHIGFISSLCIWSGPSQDYLISVSSDRTIKIWDLSNAQEETFKCIKTLTEDIGYISSLCIWSESSQDYLISGNSLGTIKIWDLSNLSNAQEETFECIKTLTGHAGYMSSLLTWSLSSQDYLISGCSDGTIEIWDLSNLSNAQEETFNCIKTLTQHSGYYMSSLLTWSLPGQDYLISGCYDGTIKIWDLNHIITQETFECIKTLTEYIGAIYKLIIYKDYLISVTSDRTIKIWDLGMTQETFECIQTLRDDYIYSLSIWSSSSQDYLISISSDRNIKIWGDLDLYHFKKEDSKLQSIYSDISKDTELRLIETCLRCFLLEESRFNLLNN